MTIVDIIAALTAQVPVVVVAILTSLLTLNELTKIKH